MKHEFEFINRHNELDQLETSFIDKVVREKMSCSYLITGPQKVGKSRLISEFFKNITTSNNILFKIEELKAYKAKKFKKEKNIIELDLLEIKDRSPYSAFKIITEKIEKQERLRRIIKSIFMLIMNATPLHDVIEDMEKLLKDIKVSDMSDELRNKNVNLFKKYIRTLKKYCRNFPLFLYIKNIQMIDDPSLELLYTIIDHERLWGMIILEDNKFTSINPNVEKHLNKLIQQEKLEKMALNPLKKVDIDGILNLRFGPKLFSKKELSYIYTQVQGCPGILATKIEDWINTNKINRFAPYNKSSDFEDIIKPGIQYVFELIIKSFKSGKDENLTKEQLEHIYTEAQRYNINEATVVRMMGTISASLKEGYEIIDKLSVKKGIFSEDVFLAKRGDNTYVMEYVSDVTVSKSGVTPAQIENPLTIVPEDFIKFEDNMIIVYKHYEGEQLPDIYGLKRREQTGEIVESAIQIAEEIQILHSKNIIIGYLNPESVRILNDKTIQLSVSFDPNEVKVYDLNVMPYFSPEMIQGNKVNKHTDIFSFGVVLYELLTGERLFKGNNKNELTKEICRIDHSMVNKKVAFIPEKLWKILTKCLKNNKNDRYQNIDELITELNEVKKNIGLLPGDQEPPPPPPPRPKKFKKAIIPAFASVLVVIVALFLFLKPSKNYEKNTILIEPFKVKTESVSATTLPPEMFEYLVKKVLMEVKTLDVFSEKEFKQIFKKKSPEFEVKGVINESLVGYNVSVRLLKTGSDKNEITIHFADKSALLETELLKLKKMIEEELNLKEMEDICFTKNWDAFEQYREGEEAWKKLNITEAGQLFKSAITIDPDFALAKFRLTEVFQFEGSTINAINILNEIQDRIEKFNELDKQKAKALKARLEGDTFQEIKILRKIYNKFPYRKECAYEVAEAYYNICDVKRAIEFYRKVLYLDTNFAKAHNHLAYCYSHTGNHKSALNHFNKYVELDNTANAYDSLGDGYLAAGQLEEAEKAKKDGIKLDSKLSYLFGSLSLINFRQGRLTESYNNAQKYIDLSGSNENKAVGNFRKALGYYLRKDYQTALDYCLKGIELHNNKNLVTRSHDLHWLISLLYLKLDQPEKTMNEMAQMKEIIDRHKINETNYRMEIYKYYLHLKACAASSSGNSEELMNAINKFEIIRDKIKDHGSIFDLSFFYTSFAESLMEDKIAKPELAEKYLLKALDYNPNYALAHFHLSNIYNKSGNPEQANIHKQKLSDVWSKADPDIKSIYGI